LYDEPTSAALLAPAVDAGLPSGARWPIASGNGFR
jgi:hypothetical protein